jgi:hypothetical protein
MPSLNFETATPIWMAKVLDISGCNPGEMELDDMNRFEMVDVQFFPTRDAADLWVRSQIQEYEDIDLRGIVFAVRPSHIHAWVTHIKTEPVSPAQAPAPPPATRRKSETTAVPSRGRRLDLRDQPERVER